MARNETGTQSCPRFAVLYGLQLKRFAIKQLPCTTLSCHRAWHTAQPRDRSVIFLDAWGRLQASQRALASQTSLSQDIPVLSPEPGTKVWFSLPVDLQAGTKVCGENRPTHPLLLSFSTFVFSSRSGRNRSGCWGAGLDHSSGM